MWQPTISMEHLKKRAVLAQKVRQFFAEREILEVDVPILGEAPVTDPYLEAMTTHCHSYPKTPFYLQTSPEYYMKRLLSAGAPSIYYLGKSFRDDERGRLHSPEFTMLEWYHLGIDDHELMAEVMAVMRLFLGEVSFQKVTYQALFEQHLGLNPHHASEQVLAEWVHQHIGPIEGLPHLLRDTALQLLMSEVIEPRLPSNVVTFIYDFPASQAALARIKGDVAGRFEVYYQGIELANGYHELSDAKTQAERFERDLAARQAQNLTRVPVDKKLLAALEHYFPECSGVALGFDRLLMLALGETHVDKVQSFGFNDLG